MKSKLTTYLIVIFTLASLTVWLYPKTQENELLNQLKDLNTFYQTAQVGQDVTYPKDLLPINGDVSFQDLVNSKDQYLLTIIDADCSSCMTDLAAWDDYLTQNKDVNPIFILTGSDKYNVDFLVNDQMSFKHPVFLDRLEEFESLNDVSFYKSFRTFHIAQNKITKVGSPLLLAGLID